MTITQMKVVEPKRTQPVRLGQHPSDTSRFRRQRFDEMQPYSAEALDAAVEAHVSATLYADDLHKVEADLQARDLHAQPQLKDVRTVKAFVVKLGNPGRKKRAEGQSQKAAIRISRVAENAPPARAGVREADGPESSLPRRGDAESHTAARRRTPLLEAAVHP